MSRAKSERRGPRRGPSALARLRRLSLIWLIAASVVGVLVWQLGTTLYKVELALGLGFLTLLIGIGAMFEEIELRQRLQRYPHAQDYTLLWLAARLIEGEPPVPGVLGISDGDLVFVPEQGEQVATGGRWLRYEIVDLRVKRGSLREWLTWGSGPLVLELVDDRPCLFRVLGAGGARRALVRCLGGLSPMQMEVPTSSAELAMVRLEGDPGSEAGSESRPESGSQPEAEAESPGSTRRPKISGDP